MYAHLAELIIASERSDSRFEQFCLNIVAKNEGVTYLPTSQSWDLGRDGRSTGRGKGSHANILCATLNEHLDAKVEADLLRVTALASPDRIVYCASQKLSEHRIDLITATIRRHTPQGSIQVYGAAQLARLAKDDIELFEQFYGAEVQDIRSTILSESPSGAPSKGLRLALLTFGSGDASALRSDVLLATLLDRLDVIVPTSVEQICTSFSTDLGLPKTVPPNFLEHTLTQAQQEGDIVRSLDGWTLTESGKQKRDALPLDGAQHLLEGRALIREQLEALLGQRFSSSQYSLVWSGLVDALGSMFHANGLEVIKAIDRMLTGTDKNEEPLNLRQMLEHGMRRVASAIVTADLQEKTNRALLDLFTERQGRAFDWLTRVSERFVTLCAIGLESTSGEALRETLVSQAVILDSDIILNYLCLAEPDHEASRDLLIGWLKLGGKLLVSPVVLEEVAHNAWISDTDFHHTIDLLGKLQRQELIRHINSPFVRTFHTFKSPAEQWPAFIGQYRGNSSGDYTKILGLLKQRLKVDVLPTSYDDGLKGRIITYLRQLSPSFGSDREHLEDVTYKMERDGRLMATIASARSRDSAESFSLPLLLLTSSSLLRAVENKFREELGEGQLVFNRRAFGYLLASIPQASLGADTLRRALFDFGSHGRLRSHDRKALRIIRATGVYDMPWAERVTLRHMLANAIKVEADRRGLKRNDIQNDIVRDINPERTAAVIVDAVQRMAVQHSVQIELEASKRTIKELEQKLADMQIKGGHRTRS